MTVLSAIQSASTVLGIDVPASLYGSTEREHVELAALVNVVARDIADANDWETLKTLETITGNGTTVAFPLPENFDRFPQDQWMWTSRTDGPLAHVPSSRDWLELQVREVGSVYGAWTKIGGELAFYPALRDGETARYYYQSREYVESAMGDRKTAFTADTDTFRLDERLLRLGVIWQFKADKGFAFEKHFAAYQEALGRAVARDKGPRSITIGERRMMKGLKTAYPRAIPG